MNMIKISNRLSLRENESGFASIVIALVLIVVLGLLTVGFAQLARNEQQQSLNKQLANQAYDAAESGINDARDAIMNGSLNSTNLPTNPNDCVNNTVLHPSINKGNGVSYPCILVNLDPPHIILNKFPALTNRYLLFSTVDPSSNDPDPAGTFTVQWSCDSSDADCASYTTPANKTAPAAAGDLLESGTWAMDHYPPLIQVSITPVPAAGFTRDQLIQNTYTAFLYPSAPGSGGTYTFSGAANLGYINTNDAAEDDGGNTPIVGGDCSAASQQSTGYLCKVSLKGIPTTSTQYLIVVSDYYETSDDIAGGQAIIDSTGQAQDVLKRIQEVVPIGSNAEAVNVPSDALTGQNICKLFTTAPSPLITNYVVPPCTTP
jgi:type II secretory pathway pseudopilin PulG